MEDLELKQRFDSVQRLVDTCVSSIYYAYTENIIRKRNMLERSKLKTLLQEEALRASDELARLYLTYPVISCVREYYAEKEFLWESTFFESLDKEQKTKWLSFVPIHFSQSTFAADHKAYDEQLPFFSSIVEAIVLEKYSVFLKETLDRCILDSLPELSTDTTDLEKEVEELCRPKEKKEVVGTSNSFNHTFEAWQIELLTECVNQARVFTTILTPEILTDFFNCTLKGVLVSNNNRLLAYLMSQLSYRGYITDAWQAVISNKRLVMGKAKQAPLSRTDLSSANDSAKPLPKGYEIIDKYIKQLKKH